LSRSRKIDRLRAFLVNSDELAASAQKRIETDEKEYASENLTSEMSEAGFVLSENETALLADDLSIPGRISDARAARLLAGVIIRTDEVRWSTEHVRLRLREAARGCERLVGRIGPSSKGGFWPQTMVEWGELVEMAGAGTLKGFQDARNSGAEREISRIEAALQWPLRYLGADDEEPARKALQLWLWCEAKNQAFEQFFRALGCSRRTAYRRRDAALETILEGVIRDKVLP